MADSLIQIVNESDIPQGASTISEAQKQGLIHRIARVMVEDPAGNILLQKRQSDRSLYPNCWDNSAAGHVDEGEDYDTAAKREMFEEIGLKDVEIKELGYYQTNGSFEGRKLNRFNKAYKVVVPSDTVFRLESEEVSEVRWFTPEEAHKMLNENPDQVTDGIIEVFQRFYQ